MTIKIQINSPSALTALKNPPPTAISTDFRDNNEDRR